MAGEKISALPAAAALDGTELTVLVQDGANVQATTQDIADLAGGGNSAPSVPLTKPVAADWTSWQNQGGSTLVDGDTGIVISFATTADPVMRGVFIPFSGTLFEVLMSGVILPTNYDRFGIVLRESGTGKMVTFSYGYAGSFKYEQARYTAFNSRDNQADLQSMQIYPWWRYRIAGGNLYREVSSTGEADAWVTLYSTTLTDWFTVGPDEAGISTNSNADIMYVTVQSAAVT